MILLIVFYIIAILAIVLIYLGLYRKFSHKFTCVRSIPTHRGVPILGDLKLMILNRNGLFLDDRDRASKFYPICKQTLLNLVAVDIYNPEDAEVVLSNMKHIKKSRIYILLEPWLGTGLLTSKDEKWQSRRKLLTPTFHFNILQEFINIFNNETNNLVKTLDSRANEVVDVIPIITDFTLKSMTETAMGVSLNYGSESIEYYKYLIDYVTETVIYRMLRPWFHNNFLYLNIFGRQLKNVVKNLHKISNDVIESRKQQFLNSSYAQRKRHAMLDRLLLAQSNGEKIDNEGIREEVDTFMFEGHDTTAVALCFILMTLANEKIHQEEIYKELVEVIGDSDEPTFQQLQNLSFTERCLKECLRLYPSVPFIARDIREDCQTKTGHTIPKGAMVHVFIYDIHRNPVIYPNPEQFDPDRFLPENIKSRHPYAYIPFSAGPRNCIGQKFAMLELKAAVAGIIRKFHLEPIDTPKDMIFLTDLVLRCDNPIRVKFVPRNKNN